MSADGAIVGHQTTLPATIRGGRVSGAGGGGRDTPGEGPGPGTAANPIQRYSGAENRVASCSRGRPDRSSVDPRSKGSRRRRIAREFEKNTTPWMNRSP